MKRVLPVFLISMMVVLGLTGTLFAATLIEVPAALDQIFPEKDSVEAVKIVLTAEMIAAIDARSETAKLTTKVGEEKTFHVAKKGGEVIGLAMEATEQGKWGLIQFLIAIDPKVTKIEDVVVLAFEEKRGKPISRRTFLEQFVGKGLSDPLEVGNDIKGVTGATVSSKAVTHAVKDSLVIYEEVYKKK